MTVTTARALPDWATLPSRYNLALVRRWHVTFAPVLALGPALCLP